jgi:hypothetical protein
MTFYNWWNNTTHFYTLMNREKEMCEAAWNAAIDAASTAIFPLDDADAAYNAVSALKTPLNTPTSLDQGQGKGQVATPGYSGPSSTAFDDQFRGA